MQPRCGHCACVHHYPMVADAFWRVTQNLSQPYTRPVPAAQITISRPFFLRALTHLPGCGSLLLKSWLLLPGHLPFPPQRAQPREPLKTTSGQSAVWDSLHSCSPPRLNQAQPRPWVWTLPAWYAHHLEDLHLRAGPGLWWLRHCAAGAQAGALQF